jgi:hypothetical protein
MNLLDPVKWGAQAAFSVTSTAVKIGMNAVRTAELLLGRNGADEDEYRYTTTSAATAEPIERDRETPGTAVRADAPPPPPAPTLPRRGRRSVSVDPPTPESRFKREQVEDEVVESEGAAAPGATLRVDEPFAGYDRMKAADIVSRLRSGDAATKAVVRLYESTHKKRKSVLAATE